MVDAEAITLLTPVPSRPRRHAPDLFKVFGFGQLGMPELPFIAEHNHSRYRTSDSRPRRLFADACKYTVSLRSFTGAAILGIKSAIDRLARPGNGRSKHTGPVWIVCGSVAVDQNRPAGPDKPPVTDAQARR
jgi:hypothetical protein